MQELANYETQGVAQDIYAEEKHTSKSREAKRLKALLNLVKVCEAK